MLKKIITERYTATIKGLIDPINRITGYLNLAKGSLNISPASFGLAALRKSIANNDIEGVIANLHIVLVNISTYKALLSEQGLSDDLIIGLTTASQSIADDRQKQFEITSNRKGIVQNNLTVLNDLYAQLTEILSVGKILYKGIDAARLSDNTFTELLKKVRQSVKTAAAQTKTASTIDDK